MNDKKKKKKKSSKVHDKLKGFEIEINEFGERVSNRSIEEINRFLNEEVDDKKLADQKDGAGEEE